MRKNPLHIFFWECQHVQKFWTDVTTWLEDGCIACTGITLSKSLVIFGIEKDFRTDHVFDLSILLAKFHIYKCRLQEKIPDLNALKNIIKHRYLVEKYRHGISGLMGKLTTNWLPYTRRSLVL